MGKTLHEQLAALPIPKLTTVLRVNFSLPEADEAFMKAMGLVETWWNKKAEPYGKELLPSTHDLSFAQGEFKIEFARTSDSFALAMEEPDSSLTARSWICDFALKLNAARPQFAVRVSFRQPHNIPNWPEPRAPRFLRDIVDQIGARDFLPLKSGGHVVGSDDFSVLTGLIESDERTLPVVVISEDDRTGEVFTNTESLARLLAGTAHVVQLDAETSWKLSNTWGKDWSTFQGAVRCYNPGFSRQDSKYKHRLWLPETIQRIDAASRNGFLNTCTAYVFTQVTAQFESWPLLTPSVIRRQIEEISRQSQAQPPLSPIRTEAQYTSIVSPHDNSAFALTELPESLQKSSGVIVELEAKLKKQEDLNRTLEDSLQQERAGRANSEKELQGAKEDLALYMQEVQSLEEQKKITVGDYSSESSEALRPLWQNLNGLFNSLHNVAKQFRRLEQDAKNYDAVNEKLQGANLEIGNLKAMIASMKQSHSESEILPEAIDSISRSTMLDILPKLGKKTPPLTTSLRTISSIFPERVVVLETAFSSAAQSEQFKHGEKVFELLWDLSTKYWETIQDGGGDAGARKVFGNSYAPRESEKLSKAGKTRRTFKYNEAPLTMEKHLKIGTADNPADTVRVHFEWFAEEKKIVIGHCGKHLAF